MLHNLRFAWRTIQRNKLFSLIALIAFAFGIGATATVFSVMDAVLLRPVTFRHPDSLVVVQALQGKRGWENVTPYAFHQMRAQSALFSQVVGYRTAIFTVTRVPSPDQVFGLSVSPALFEMLDAPAWRGRSLLPQDEKPGSPLVAVVGYQAWQKMFASDPNIIGRTAEIDGELHTIVGVMPRSFLVPGYGGVLWTPLHVSPADLASKQGRWVHVLARLRPGVSSTRAQDALSGLAAGLPPVDGKRVQLRTNLWHNETNKTYREIIWLAMGMVFGLLLLGCANLSSLLLARSISRNRDFAIRLATGASRVQLIRQSLLEVLLLAFAGLAIACVGASAVLSLLRNFFAVSPTGMPDLSRIQLSAQALLFSFAVALASALLCGFFPALSATAIDLSTSLRQSGTQLAGSKSVRRFLRGVIVVEAGIAMLLLVTSGLLVRGLTRLLSDDHGLKPDHILTLHLPSGSYQRASPSFTKEDRQRRTHQYLALMRRSQAIQGVQAVALASSLPLSHAVVRTEMKAPGRSPSDAPPILPITQAVTPDYFRVMGTPLLAGRAFQSSDAASNLKFAIVNQSFVRKYFEGENVVGKLLNAGEDNKTQIIGVVKDSPHLNYSEVVEPELYFDFEQTLLTPFLTGMVVRTAGDPRMLEGSLRAALATGDARQAVVQVRTLQSLIDENVWQPRFSAWLFAAFAALAVCLAGIGIYGVVAYVTTATRRDFGIRLALGANSMSLFRLVTQQSLAPVFLGVLLGGGASYWAGQWVASLLYKTNPSDSATALVSAVVLIAIAFAASLVPALKAARVDPSITLRSE